MMQNLANTRTYRFNAANVTANVLTAGPARLVQFQAAAGNTGTVTILGVDPNGTVDSFGPTLAAGEWSPSFWVLDLSQLAYKLSVSAEVVYVVVGR